DEEEEEEEDDDEEDDDDDEDDEAAAAAAARPDMSHSISRISETLAGIYDDNSLSQDFPGSEKGPEEAEPSSSPASRPPRPDKAPAEPSEPKEQPPGADSTLPEEENASEQSDGAEPEPRRLTALLFKMEEANLASRAKAQELIQATNQVGTRRGGQQGRHPPCGGRGGPNPGVPPPQRGCGEGVAGKRDGSVSSEGRGDTDKYLKKLHTQERAVEEVKLAIKPYYQKKEITKDEYKDILRKAVHKICHSKSGEINPVKVNNLVKAYVQRYKYFRKRGRRVEEEPGGPPKELGGPLDKAPLPMPPL
uniref:SFR19-like C-terminal domain-containing protein n=1 Tax=Apteryx owenii TaxID=8824 RepID=A0A8B9PPZ2_APTOW